jgi:hypothetical protein
MRDCDSKTVAGELASGNTAEAFVFLKNEIAVVQTGKSSLRRAVRPESAAVRRSSSPQLAVIKLELQDKERALADLSVELAILRKKTNGGSWDR